MVEPPRPQVTPVNEESRIRAVITRYELGYNNLDAGIVRSVYPTANPKLAAIFADYQFYRLGILVENVHIEANGTAVARCKLFHTMRSKKINARDQQADEERDVARQKQGDTWVITGLRRR